MTKLTCNSLSFTRQTGRCVLTKHALPAIEGNHLTIIIVLYSGPGIISQIIHQYFQFQKKKIVNSVTLSFFNYTNLHNHSLNLREHKIKISIKIVLNVEEIYHFSF